MRGKWRAWVADRFGLAPVRENFLKRRVPRDPWYFGDGATLLLLLMVQVVTGAVLALSYTPTPDAAYASVEQITDGQPFGRFLRGLHYWSAGLMVIMLFFHLFRQVLVGGYKFPREGTWLIGVGLFFAVLVMAFTGYVLRWDERAVHAVRVVLHMFYQVPVIGEALVYFVQGGPAIDGLLRCSRDFHSAGAAGAGGLSRLPRRAARDHLAFGTQPRHPLGAGTAHALRAGLELHGAR
jgi:ubiquinol-cytochrome c reductase cytochrome b subunit